MNKLQVLIGIIGLLVGSLVYLIDRPPQQTYFIFQLMELGYRQDGVPLNIFGPISGCFPTFIHAFSFILLTAAILCCEKRGYFVICLCWFVIDCIFELAQKFSSLSLMVIPDWFESIPFLENTKNYLMRGTFDIFDLVSIAFGCGSAYLVLLTTTQRGGFE